MPPSHIESAGNVKPLIVTNDQVGSLNEYNLILTLDRVYQRAEVHSSYDPGHPLDVLVHEMVIQMGPWTVGHHLQSYSVHPVQIEDQTQDRNFLVDRTVVRYLMVIQMVHFQPAHYRVDQMSSEMEEGNLKTLVDLDQASMILMVREMLCIVVYLSRAVGLENYSVAYCLPVSLDLIVETRALTRSC